VENNYKFYAFCFYQEATDQPMSETPPENANRYYNMETALEDLYEAWRTTQNLGQYEIDQPDWFIEIYQ